MSRDYIHKYIYVMLREVSTKYFVFYFVERRRQTAEERTEGTAVGTAGFFRRAFRRTVW